MPEPTGPITASWLNGLTVDQRKELLGGRWSAQMHQWAASHVTYIFWTRRTLLGTLALRSASAFFLDFGDRVFAVTAAHVYEAYLRDKRISPRSIVCQLGNVTFRPEERIRSSDSSPACDIATFDVTRNEISRTGKQAVLTSPWPPPTPVVNQAAFLVGFPGTLRFWLSRKAMTFGLYNGLGPITALSDTTIKCAFEREFWVAAAGDRLPLPGQDLGGMSGGPVLLPLEADGAWHLTLAGVISRAVFNEVVYATRAHIILPDGMIDR